MTRTLLLTGLALAAFAANSILCRLALRDELIDPASFTSLRLLSGAIVLLPFARRSTARWHLPSAAALFVYALAFSLAYVTLDAGTGALLLFGLVQVTMLGVSWVRGERPARAEILGFLAALAGVAWLVSPGVSSPDPLGAVLMSTAGVAWGVYSLLGRGATDPAAATARNFVLATPAALVASLFFSGDFAVATRGAWLAVCSGAITSGLGYVVWYAALRGHTRASAGIVQLSVPFLAALAGTLLLDEVLTFRLIGSGVLTLGGVALALRAHKLRA